MPKPNKKPHDAARKIVRREDRPGQPKERLIKDEQVPQLARRIRTTRETWVVFVPEPGRRARKVTLGACNAIHPDHARTLARDLLKGPDTSSQETNPNLSDFSDTFLKDCAARWRASTLRSHRHCLRVQVLPTLGQLQIDEINRQDVTAWFHEMDASKGARNRALSVLSSLLTHAELRGLRTPDSNPCKGLRRHGTSFKATYLDAAGYAALGRAFDRLSERHFVAAQALRFCALTGCRKSEALSLKWAMLDGPRAALPESKSGPKSIWLGKPVQRLLAGLPRTGTFVFAQDGKPLAVHALDRVWHDVRADIGQPKLRLHDLRHSFASVAIAEGLDLLMIGGLLGHADKGSTAGYAHLDTEAVAAATKRVGQHLAKVIAKKPRRIRRKVDRPFAAFVRSKDSLPAFCAARGLDPDRFRKGLAAWRAENRRASK